jgi:HSP20 family protein
MTLTKFRTPSGTAMPHLLDTLLGRDFFDYLNASPAGTTLPAVNIRENNDAFVVEVAAPGFAKEDFKIRLEDHQLLISSEKEAAPGNEGKEAYTRREFSYQSFRRAFTLPKSVERDSISATYQDGILSIHVPKRDEAKAKPPREIQVL